LSKKNTTTRSFLSDTQALGSTFSNNGTLLSANNNLSILAATKTYTESDFSETKKSGLMSGGGIGKSTSAIGEEVLHGLA
jgi:hypothetical protein